MVPCVQQRNNKKGRSLAMENSFVINLASVVILIAFILALIGGRDDEER